MASHLHGTGAEPLVFVFSLTFAREQLRERRVPGRRGRPIREAGGPHSRPAGLVLQGFYRLNPRSSCSARSRPSDSSSAVTRRPIVASIALARMNVSTPA